MAGVKHTQMPKGLGVANLKDNANPPSVVSSDPYLKTFVIPLPLVASASAQSINVSTIKDWPAYSFNVIDSYVNVRTAESTGTTKTLSAGYTGANTGFLNAQTCAAAGAFAGARPTVNIATKTAITYTFGSNNWAEAVLELVLTGIAQDAA